MGKVPSIKDTNAAIRIIPNDVISSEARLLPYGQQIGSGMIDDYMSNMSQRFIKGEDITPVREQFIRQHGNALKKAMETIAGFTLPVASYQYINKDK